MLLSNGLDMNFCALDSKIADIHPGETVLNFSNSGKIFHKKQVSAHCLQKLSFIFLAMDVPIVAWFLH